MNVVLVEILLNKTIPVQSNGNELVINDFVFKLSINKVFNLILYENLFNFLAFVLSEYKNVSGGCNLYRSVKDLGSELSVVF